MTNAGANDCFPAWATKHIIDNCMNVISCDVNGNTPWQKKNIVLVCVVLNFERETQFVKHTKADNHQTSTIWDHSQQLVFAPFCFSEKRFP